MRTATGEPEPDVTKIRELEERLDRFRIQTSPASPDITIRGNAWQGYALNVPPCEVQEVTPGTGACCLPDGTCEVVTPGQCLLDGGIFIGGSCVPNPCTTPPMNCSIPCLQTHVVGDVSFSGTYSYFGIDFTMDASGSLDDDLVDFGLFREFQSTMFGTAHVTNSIGCDETHPFEIEVKVSCDGDAWFIHLFALITMCSSSITATFGYDAHFTPPVTGETFILSDLTGGHCTGICTGSMTLTLTDPC